MFKINNSKHLSLLIIIFPPIILLLYAISAYIIFFNSQSSQNSKVLSIQEDSIKSLIVKSLKSEVESINNFFNKSDIDEAFKLLNSIKLKDGTGIVVYKDNQVVFQKGAIEQYLISKLESAKNSFETSKYLLVVKFNKKHNLKIVIAVNKNIYLNLLQKVKHSLNSSTKEAVIKSLFWLAISWFLLLIISLVLGLIVFRKIREYQETIKLNNERIIFQSRQALLGELLPMIAHQWRQPLNKIASVLIRMRFELLNGNPNIDTLDRQAQTIEDSVELMSNTIDDFRTFYRPKENAEETDLALIIRKAIYFLDELLQNKKIKIHSDLSSVKVKLHPNEFLQVIINLIKNASDAVDINGQISISLKEYENVAEIRIEDNGTGIPEDKLEEIFEPHISSKQGSMGLGLYMSRLIIQSHMGGIIKAYNTKDGAGFVIRIPKN